MTTLNRYTSGALLKKPASRMLAYCFYAAGVLVAIAASAVLIAAELVW